MAFNATLIIVVAHCVHRTVGLYLVKSILFWSFRLQSKDSCGVRRGSSRPSEESGIDGQL